MDDDRERWNKRYRAGAHAGLHPASFVQGASRARPAPGRLLDVAGGSGRNAVFLAGQGFAVTLADVSDVAIQLAGARAAEAGVDLTCVRLDLQTAALPSGPWDVMVAFHYLDRGLFPRFGQALAPGGQLWFCQPTVVNLERHPRPSARFLLAVGEARQLVEEAGLTVVSFAEDWSAEGRHEARVVAQCPG